MNQAFFIYPLRDEGISPQDSFLPQKWIASIKDRFFTSCFSPVSSSLSSSTNLYGNKGMHILFLISPHHPSTIFCASFITKFFLKNFTKLQFSSMFGGCA